MHRLETHVDPNAATFRTYYQHNKALAAELERFPGAEVVWCQEEPRNQGAWAFVQPYIEWVLEQIQATSRRPRYTGRRASASTATGLMSSHLKQLKAFLDEALG